MDCIYLESQQLPEPNINNEENDCDNIDTLKVQMSAMSAEWLTQMHHYILAADTDEILTLLELVPAENNDLVKAIVNFTENYDFNSILVLLN